MRWSETLRVSLKDPWSSMSLAMLASRAIALTLALASGTSVVYGADGALASEVSPVVNDASVADSVPLLADIASVLWKQFRVAKAESRVIAQAVLSAADRCSMSPLLLLAVIATESGFDRHATRGW